MKTKHLVSAIALIIAGTAASQSYAQATLEQRVDALERENTRMREQLGAQEERIQGAPERVKELEEELNKERGGGNWFENIEIAGLIEVEAGYFEDFADPKVPSESDIVLATFELGIASQVTSWVEAGASLLYEEDDTDLEVDTAYITIYNPDVAPVFFTGGQIYVPFGTYETNLIDDPLTLEIGETRETAAQLGFEYEGFGGSVYGFSGDNKVKGKNRINGWGANLGYAWENDDWSIGIGGGYINDLGDSDTLQDAVAENRAFIQSEIDGTNDAIAEENAERLELGEDPIPEFTVPGFLGEDPNDRTGGWTANLFIGYRGFNLIAEYLSATDHFDPLSLPYKVEETDGGVVVTGAQPSAWNIELGYTFEVRGYENVVAAAYQGTEEAIALGLPRQSYLVGWSIGIFDNTALSLQYRHDVDYDKKDGGSGKSGDSVLAQLAVEF